MDTVQMIRMFMRRVYPLFVGLLLGAWAVFSNAAPPVPSYGGFSSSGAFISDCSSRYAAANPPRTATDGTVAFLQAYCEAGSDDGQVFNYKQVRVDQNCSSYQTVYNPGPVTVCSAYRNDSYINARTLGITLMCADGTSPNLSKPTDQQCPDSCKSPYVKNAQGTCEDPCKDKAGKEVNGSIPADKSPVNVCFGNCQADIVTASNQWKLKGEGGVQMTVGTWKYTGSLGKCDPSASGGAQYPSAKEPPTDKESAYSCAKKGMAYGEVNGTGMCVKPSTDNKVETTKKTTGSSSTSTTGPDGQTVTDTKTTETTTTVTDDGSGNPQVTTTTTTTDGSGSSSQETKAGDQKTFCQQNPTLSICKEATWSGNCGQGAPKCSGDAVDCAVAAQTLAMKCALTESTAAGEFGLKLANGQDPDKALLPTKENATETDIQQVLGDAVASGGSLGAGQCPQDKVVSVGSRSFTLPLSSVCPYLDVIGNLVVAASMVGAMFIIGKG